LRAISFRNFLSQQQHHHHHHHHHHQADKKPEQNLGIIWRAYHLCVPRFIVIIISLLFLFKFFSSLTRTRRGCLKPWLSLWVICFFPVLAEFELIWFLCFGGQNRTRKQPVSTAEIQLTKAIKK